MKVKLVPGPRNEELIERIRRLIKSKDQVALDGYLELLSYKRTPEASAFLDALYYASQTGEAGLKDQEEYFDWLLLEEEFNYFVDRMTGELSPDSEDEE